MANAIPPPAQRLINCFRDTSPTTRARAISGIVISLFCSFVVGVVVLGLGFSKKLSKEVGTPLAGSLLAVIIILGMTLIIISFCNNHIPTRYAPVIFQPRLLRISSEDSGLGSSSSSLFNLQNDNPRRNLNTSRDSGINVDLV